MNISLIIPAYNEEKYIGQCLDSVLSNPRNRFFEIIVVDNASTDNTAAIAEARAGVRVVQERSKGLTRARQKGFLEAGGDILAYIDADTRMPENWFQQVAESFEKNSKLAALSGPYFYYDIPRWQQLLVGAYWRAAVLIYSLLGYMVVGGNFAIRKSVLQQMNGFDTTVEFYGEDTDIARRAAKFGEVKFKLSLLMPTSGRRVTQEGLIPTAYTYVINFLSEIFFHKPATQGYKDIRK